MLEPKFLIQSLWAQKIGWDENSPEDILSPLIPWKRNLHLIKNVCVPHWIKFLEDETDKIELHPYADVSMKAHEAVSYLHVVNNKHVYCRFILGKVRLSPLQSSNKIP